MAHIFSVRELATALKDVVEGEFAFVWVRGQVSNLSRPASGHCYFSVKDEDAVLPVVWFKSSQWRGEGGSVNPVTGEVQEGPALQLADGMQVLVAGRLSIYAPRGTYQLVAELVEDQGLGRLHQAFEALKAELAALGWFDAARKRPVPFGPQRVALVTAPGGAAIRDFLRIAAERGSGCQIRLHPTLVQGDTAPAAIAAAIAEAGRQGWAQVVVVIRGGGSLEDLWAFNTRPVAQALVDCPLPVVCGVGHEVDTSIADMVADLRAATPSHAAQLLWPERRELAQSVDDLELRLRAGWNEYMDGVLRDLTALERGLSWLSPRTRLDRALERLTEMERGLDRVGQAAVHGREELLAGLGRRLAQALGPAALQTRALQLRSLTDRLALVMGPAALRGRDAELAALGGRLGKAGDLLLERRHAALATQEAHLVGADPLAPLARGYGLVTVRRTGRYLRSPAEVRDGETLEIKVRDGIVHATVDAADSPESGDGIE